MPSVEELLDQAETYTETGQVKEDNVYCVIDAETRTIDVPEQYSLLGVESDEKVERIWFQCSKIVGDNIDLSKLQIRVNYQNANNETDQYIVTDVQTDGDNIIFSWLLSRKVTAYLGNVSFIVCAVKVSGETIQNEWNTTLATAQVLQGLEVEEPEITEEESDVIAQLLQIMMDTSEQAVSDVNVAKTNAISAITAQQVESVSAVQSAQSTAVQAVENAGELIEASLPSDYTELSNKVDELDRTKAPAITESTSGESIQLSDSGDAPLTDIKLYGKSKQVTTTGAQLFDVDTANIIQGVRESEWGGFQEADPKRLTTENMTHIQEGGQYTLSVKSYKDNINIQVNVWVYDENGIYLSDELQGAYVDVPATFTLNSNRKINFGFKNSDNSNILPTDIGEIMLNAGSTSLPWEPYTGGKASPSPDYPQEIEIPGSERNVEITASDGDEQIKNVTLPTPNGLPGIPVTSGGNYTDSDGQQWICDEIDFKRGKYVQRVIKYTGPYSPYYRNTNDSWFVTVARLENPPKSEYGGFCNVSSSYRRSWDTLDHSHWFLQAIFQPQIVIYLGDKYNTEEATQQFIAENEIVVYCVADTPIEANLSEEQLSALKQLRTYQTVTNITTDSEPQVGMEIEYTADTKTYIDNKFAELAQSLAATQNTLLQEV